jgi:F0F1-type ATP synthase membrane subunit c/vacuolar-type H+-ATPase subunit K
MPLKLWVRPIAVLVGGSVILTVVMGAWVESIYNDPRMGGEYIAVLLPVTLWMVGMVVVIVLALAVAVLGLKNQRSAQELEKPPESPPKGS